MTSQLTLDAALTQVGANNEPWLAWARRWAQGRCTAYGITTDDLREQADLMGYQPDSPHAWGAVFKAPGWRCVGREPSRYKSNNSRWIGRWTYDPRRTL